MANCRVGRINVITLSVGVVSCFLSTSRGAKESIASLPLVAVNGEGVLEVITAGSHVRLFDNAAERFGTKLFA